MLNRGPAAAYPLDCGYGLVKSRSRAEGNEETVKLIGRICPVVLCVMTCSWWCSTLSAQQPPAPPRPAQQPPVPPKAPAAQPQAPDNIERMFSISLYDWLPSGGPSLRAGTLAILPPPHDLTLPKKPSRAFGAMITIPMKGSTRLEVSYMTINDRGNALAPTDLGLFGGTIAQDEPLAMDYSLRHLKVSWNYLTYPNPPQDAKFRVKTLWDFHYMRVNPTVVATVTAPDQPLSEKQSIKLPAVGLGMEYVPSRHFRIEARGSGMGIPNHSAIGDGDATVVGRVGKLEIFGGGKAFYFRTSPKTGYVREGILVGALRRHPLGVRITRSGLRSRSGPESRVFPRRARGRAPAALRIRNSRCVRAAGSKSRSGL